MRAQVDSCVGMHKNRGRLRNLLGMRDALTMQSRIATALEGPKLEFRLDLGRIR